MEALTKLASTFKQDEMIRIALEDGGTFSVQKAILRNASAYFEKSLQDHFKEGQDKRLRLPGCTTATFELFLYWLCNSKLPDFKSDLEDDRSSELHTKVIADIQTRLVRLWASADMWMMPALQNAAMRALHELLSVVDTQPVAVKTAFEIMPAESLIVKALVIDLASSWGTSDCFMSLEGLEDLGQTPGFFIAFTREMFSGEGSTMKVREPFCDYEISEFLV